MEVVNKKEKVKGNPSTGQHIGRILADEASRTAIAFFENEILPRILTVSPLDAKQMAYDDLLCWEITLVVSILGGRMVNYKIIINGETGEVMGYSLVTA